MSVTFDIKLSPEADALLKRLADAPGLGAAVARTMDRQNELTVRAVHAKLSGPVLRVDTGKLRRSIMRTQAYSMEHSGGFEVRSTVGSHEGFLGAQAVKYAAIHEFGGTIVPVRAKWLMFKVGDRWVRTKKVVMPERSYLRSTVRERLGHYGAALSRTVVEFLAGKGAAA